MLRHVLRNRILFIITSVFSLAASLVGVFYPPLYDLVVPDRIMPGLFTQDLVVILASLILLGLALTLRRGQYRKEIIILGILGFLFYAYGIFALEQIYTLLYPLYLAIFGMSFFGLIYALSSLEKSAAEDLTIPSGLRFGAAGYGFLIALIFNMIWFSQLIPLLKTGERIEYTFSVYIIDLVFIMPAFVMAGVMTIRRQALGLVGLPALFVVGAGILSPLALAEVIKPSRYGLPFVSGDFWLFTILSGVFLILAVVYLLALRPNRQRFPAQGEYFYR